MTDNPLIVYNYAARSRKDNFFRGLQNIITFAHHENYQIICTLDIDDPELCNDQVKNALSTYPKVKAYWGTSNRSKVCAINRSIPWFPNEMKILINFSDDQVFTQPGFDKIIIDELYKAFPDGDGFLHFPDNYAGARLATMSIMGAAYFRRFNYIYHPLYSSVYCDNEAHLVSQRLGKYAFVNKRIFDHIHPATGMIPMDAQYNHTESFYGIDGPIFRERLARNFDLP